MNKSHLKVLTNQDTWEAKEGLPKARKINTRIDPLQIV